MGKAKYSTKFKRSLLEEWAKGEKNILNIAVENGVHPTQIYKWRREDNMGILGINDPPEKYTVAELKHIFLLISSNLDNAMEILRDCIGPLDNLISIVNKSEGE
jgi:transposase-like protein